VDSELEHGACFTIYLPAIRQAIATPTVRKATATPGGTETVLVVEDEDMLRKGICEFLRGLGYRVLSANSGVKGLTVAKEQPHIDLLLTDMVMPKMSGMELAQLLRSLRPELKIMLMSGYSGDELLGPGMQEPYTAMLQKPFGLGTLAKRVRDTLDTKPLDTKPLDTGLTPPSSYEAAQFSSPLSSPLSAPLSQR
jgi:CheY-like chemotaxis protein